MENRKYSVDLLKIFATFMITTLHILLVSALNQNLKLPQFLQTWFLELFCLPAVNIYALITGYLCYEKEIKVKKLVNFYTKTLFFSVLSFLFLGILINGGFWSYEWISKSIFVVSNNSYWYLTAYLVTMLFSPLLNTGIKTLPQKSLKKTLILLFCFMSLIPLFMTKNAPYINNGYDAIWLIYLYLLGGYFAKYVTIETMKKHKWKLIVLLFLSVGLSLCLKTIGGFYKIESFESLNLHLNSYNSLFVFLQAVCLFCIFIPIEVKSKRIKKLLKYISDKTYWIYIVHCGPITLTTVTATIGQFLNINNTIIAHKVLILSVVLFIVSLIITLFFNLLWSIIDKTFKLCFNKTPYIDTKSN